MTRFDLAIIYIVLASFVGLAHSTIVDAESSHKIRYTASEQMYEPWPNRNITFEEPVEKIRIESTLTICKKEKCYSVQDRLDALFYAILVLSAFIAILGGAVVALWRLRR